MGFPFDVFFFASADSSGSIMATVLLVICSARAILVFRGFCDAFGAIVVVKVYQDSVPIGDFRSWMMVVGNMVVRLFNGVQAPICRS